MEVSHPERVVYPDVGTTKGEVVRYVERLAPKLLAHVVDRPLSLRRYPRGLAGPGFFQKNMPAHYPASFGRLEVPRSREATRKHARDAKSEDVTVYPVVRSAEHLVYLANQNALELHVPTVRVGALDRPDRLVLDLDPPLGDVELVRRGAHLARERLAQLGLASFPVATGSKGYHVVAPLVPSVEQHAIAEAGQKLATLLEAEAPDVFTTRFRVSERGRRVFVDWLRNRPLATVVAPFSPRARPNASVAVPLTWAELDVIAPDAFTLADASAIASREDPLATAPASDPTAAVAAIDAAFAGAGLVLTPFDRFRS